MPISFQQRLALDQNVWSESARQELCDLRVAIPGIVQSFDNVKQTCAVKVAIQEWVNVPLPATNGIPSQARNNPQWVTIVVEDVPVVFPRAGGFSITFPVVPGDECLLVFADACIDAWYVNGGVQAQMAKRRHSLSDAFALFGPWSQKRTLANYSTSSLQIRANNGSVSIDITDGKITITAPEVEVVASGGTAQSLLQEAFYTWFTTVYMPAVQYVSVAPALPTPEPLTTVLSGE